MATEVQIKVSPDQDTPPVRNMKYLKTIVLNLFLIIAPSVAVALLTVRLDKLLGLQSYNSTFAFALGVLFLTVGLIFRFWASFAFYDNYLAVLWMKPQQSLVTSGPYKFSRNPLYIGIIGIFLGAVLMAGSISGIVLTVLLFLAWDVWVRFGEEKDMEKTFGDTYREYKNRVPRWITLW